MPTKEKYDLAQYKTDTERQLEQKRSAAKEAANISYQKLLKYLPRQTAGYSVGMTETAKIAANNSLQQQMAAADSEHAASVTELNNYVREQEEAAEQRAYERDRLEKADAAAEQDKAYDAALTMIDSQSWNTVAELENYIKGYEGKVSDTQMTDLENRLNFYRNNTDQQAADEAYEANKNLTAIAGKAEDIGGYLENTDEGNNFKIGGYKVELGTEVGESVVPAAKAASIGDKVPFAYNGGIYIKIDGTVYSVRGRGGKLNSDGYKKALDYLIDPPSEADLGVYGTITSDLLSGAKPAN